MEIRQIFTNIITNINVPFENQKPSEKKRKLEKLENK